MAYSVAGKRVLITGASSGLGAALARQLAAQQAVVGLVARRRARLAEVLTDCQRTSPDSAMWVADLADAGAVGEVALQAWDGLGGVDVLRKQVRAVRLERGDGRGPARYRDLGEADRAGPGRHRDLGPARQRGTALPGAQGRRRRGRRGHHRGPGQRPIRALRARYEGSCRCQERRPRHIHRRCGGHGTAMKALVFGVPPDPFEVPVNANSLTQNLARTPTALRQVPDPQLP